MLVDLAWRVGRAGGVVVNHHAITAAQMTQNVRALQEHFDLIAYDELSDRLARPRSRPFCLLTFDDGKRSHATVTAPVLDELGVRAVFYVCTGFLDDGGSALWFDRYAALEKVGDPSSNGLAQEVVKLLPAKLRDERLNAAVGHHRVTVDLTDDDVAPMDWDQARSLHKRGHCVGAHTRWHAILPRETAEDAKAEIRASVLSVREEIGECRTFAFPNGNYTAELAHHAIACGVETVMTTEPTWVSDHPLWRLPRIQLFGRQDSNTVVLKLAVARVGRVLANPDGTGRLYVLINRRAAVSA